MRGNPARPDLTGRGGEQYPPSTQPMGTHPEVTKGVATLLKKQKGKCSHCGLFFKDEDLLEKDHIIPKANGGNNSYNNLQLLHRHCHDTKTAADKADVRHQLDKEYL